MGEMHAKKITKIYDMAMKMGAPVIGLVDCAGLRLQEATDALNAFGELYLKQAMASGVVPQISAIFGSCGGGLAVVPALSDFAFMESKGKMFINSRMRSRVTVLKNAILLPQSSKSEKNGCIDAVGTEDEIIAEIRELVSSFL